MSSAETALSRVHGHWGVPVALLVASLLSPLRAEVEEAEAVSRFLLQHLGIEAVDCPAPVRERHDGEPICAPYPAHFSSFKSRWEFALARYDVPAEVESDSEWTLKPGRYSRTYEGGDWTLTVEFEQAARLAVIAYAEDLRHDDGFVEVREGIECPGSGDPSTEPTAEDGIHWAGRGDVSEPRLLRRRGQASYPDEALEARKTGVVCLKVYVLSDGTVSGVEVLSSSEPGFGFERSASRWVEEWSYEPARKGEEPVPVYHTVVVEFQLRGDDGAGP